MKPLKLIIACLFVPLAAHAEHLFEVGLRAGMAGYNAQCHYVSPVSGIHGGMLLSYAYHSPYVVGVRVAATVDRSQAGFSIIDYTDSYSVIDVENEEMQVDYTIGRLDERYTTWSVGIPIQLAIARKNFYLYCGPKMVFPVQSQWSETAEKAALSVYYPLRDNRVYDSYPLAASPSFREAQNGSMQQAPKVQFWLAAELGYDIRIHTGARTISYLSIGVYADYCFSSMAADPSERISLIMLSDTRDGFPLQRILTPVVAAQRQGIRLVSSWRPLDFGIKISYRIAPYHSLKRAVYPCRCYGNGYF